jgi:phage tail-like protein
VIEQENVCLLVQRAGTTREFRLYGQTIRFGYAPGGDNDLVLHDSLLDDVQGTIEYQGDNQEDDFTAYRLRVKSAGVQIEGVSLPPREAVAIRLRIGQRIKVGDHYHLTVARYAAANGEHIEAASAVAAIMARAQQRVIPGALQEYMAVSRLFFPYLPEIYRSDEIAGPDAPAFLARYLGIFESVFLPLQWTAQNFALCLQPRSAPPELLPWLADWYGVPARIDFLSDQEQRALLGALHDLLERKGTHAGLCEFLHAYVGARPTIVDEEESNRFSVEFSTKPVWWEQHRDQVARLIEWYKPAHTSFELK